MKKFNEPYWWRYPIFAGGKKILDPATWRKKWEGKEYRTSPKLIPILKQLRRTGADSNYIEWLLHPQHLKGRHGYPNSRLPEKAQQQIIDLFEDLDELLKRMREMVEEQMLPGKPVETLRQQFSSFEKDVEPACPWIAGSAQVLKEFRENNRFLGRPSEERILIAFLISEELRVYSPHRYWTDVAKLLEIRFPKDKFWSTPARLSRAVKLHKARKPVQAAGTLASYRDWFKRRTSPGTTP